MTLYIRTRQTGVGKRYDVRYRLGGRYTRVEHGGTFQTKKDATIRMSTIASLLAAGKDPRDELRHAGREIPTLADLHERWLTSRRDVAEGTRDGYRHREPVLLDEFGSKHVDRITVADINAWVGDLAEEYEPGTVRLFVSQLRMTLDFADFLDTNVARDRRVKLPRLTKKEVHPPNADEVLTILHGVEPNLRLPIITMERLGSRISETLTLEPVDIDQAGYKVRFPRERTKGQRVGRMLDAPSFLVDALGERLPLRGLNRSKVRDHMRRQPGGFSPHDLRHRRISLWHQAGVPAVELARRSGHSKASMSLDVYSHVMPLDEIPDETLAELVSA